MVYDAARIVAGKDGPKMGIDGVNDQYLHDCGINSTRSESGCQVCLQHLSWGWTLGNWLRTLENQDKLNNNLNMDA